MQQTSSVHNDCDSVKHFQQNNSERGIYDSKYGTTENLKLKPNQDVKPEYKKPDFALKPHSVTAGPGLSAIFLCRPTGEPPPTVQWIKQGEVIQKGSKYWISSDEDCILEIRKVTHEDSGQYTCMLTNAAGSVSTEATLIVMETVSQPTTPSNARSLLRKTSNQEISLDVAKTSSNSFSMGQHQSNHGNNLYPVSTDLKKGSVHNPSCSKKVTEITQKLQGTHNFNGTNNSGRVEGNRINDSPNIGLEGRLGRKYSAPLQYNTGKSRSQDSSELQPLIERLNRLQQFDHKPLKSPVQSPGVDYRQVLKSKQRSESVPRKGSFPEDGARDGVNNDIRRDKGTAKHSECLNKNSENNAFRAKISQKDIQSVGGNNRFKDDKVDVKIIQGSKVSSLRNAFTADRVENHPIKTNNKTTYKLQNDPIKFNVRNNSPSFVPKNEQMASTVSSTFTSTPPVDACNKSNRALQTKKSLHKESHESFENKLYSHSNAPKSGEILPGQSKIIPEIPANGETILSKTEQEKSFPTRNSPTVKIEFSEEEDFRAMLDKRRKNSPFLSKRSQLAEETNENEIKHSEISRQKEINTDVMRTAVTNSKSLNCKSEVGIPSQEGILALSQKTPNYCDSTYIVSSNQITESELEELLQRRKNRRKMQENYLKDANEHQNIKNCSEETTKRNVKTEEKFDSAPIVHDGQNVKENSNSEERKNSYKVNTVKTDIKNKMDTNSDHQSKVIKDCVKNEVEPDLENEDFRSILSKRKRNNSLGKLQTKDRSPVGLVQTDFRHVLTRHVESDNRQPPMFQSRAYDQKVQEGQPVTMELAVTGVPKPMITWSIHDKIIKPSKFFKMTYEDNTARLVIDGAYPEDDGLYTCTATNSVGSERCSCRLFVQELFNSQSEDDMSADTPVNKAPPVIDFTTEINEFQSHTMSGAPYVPENDFASTSDDEPPETAKLVAPCIHEINPNMVTKSKGEKVIIQASFTSDEKPTVKWYRGQEELIKGNDIFISATEHFSRLTISNIGKDDAGKYTITVTNSAGSVSSSATISVQDVPDPPIGRPYASEVNLRSVIIAWSGPAYDGGCQVTGYQVEICDAEGENWQTLPEHCHSTSYHVGNLQPLSPYFFRVCAKNKHGYSKPSEVSAVIVTKDKRPDLHLSIDSDDEELPFEPRDVVIRTDQPFEDDYDLKEEVGKGKFGKVFKCTEKTSGRTFAAKVLRCRTKREKETIHGEIAVMNQLTHPKLLMLWDAYETSKSMVLVMEYVAGGELFDRVADEDLELTERDCVHFVRQICDGVHYMHGKSILHLDLKPENILCVHKENNLVKIIDFGLARVHTEGESLKVMFGTPEFIAPEVVNYEEIGFSTDIWSLGVICYVLLSGLSPFMGDSDVETLANVTRGDFDFDDEAFEEISETAKGFIKSALQKNKKKRPAIEDCINHRWLAQSERNSCKKLRQSLRNLKQFMARRKWQKMGNAIRAVGRMSSVMQRMGKSGSGSESSINNDSEPSSQTEHIVAPSRTVSQQEVKDSAMTQNSPKSSEGSVVFKKETDVTVHDTSHKVNQGVNSEQPSNYETPSSYSRTKRKITFIKEMVDCEAFQGDIVRFDVKISCDSHVTIQWFHEDTLIEEDRQHSFVENIEECCTEASLIIKDVTLHNEGDYTCQCSSDEEEITCYGSLSVYGSGSI